MSQNASLIIAMFILGGITFSYRYAFISDLGKGLANKIPEKFLRLLGPSTFSAIIANNILNTPASDQEFKQKVIVATLALLIAYISKSIIVTLVFGMGLLFLLQNFF